jgi:Family of unknown function (DUF6011)
MCLMCDPNQIHAFVTAGNATLTLTSAKTSAHYTYKVQKKDSGFFFFVSLLTGPDNSSNYKYLGLLTQSGFRTTGKSCQGPDSKPARAFAWMVDKVMFEKKNPATVALEVRHMNKCGRCGRPLTTPESIDRGLGPECAKM